MELERQVEYEGAGPRGDAYFLYSDRGLPYDYEEYNLYSSFWTPYVQYRDGFTYLDI